LALAQAWGPATVWGSVRSKGSVSRPEVRWRGSVARSVPRLAEASGDRVAGSGWRLALRRSDCPAKARSSPALCRRCQRLPPHRARESASLTGSRRPAAAKRTAARAHRGRAADWPVRLAFRLRPQHARSDGTTTRPQRRRPRRRRPWHPVPGGPEGSVAAVCQGRQAGLSRVRRQPSRPRRRNRGTLRRTWPNIGRMRRPRRRGTSVARLA
jgi:hypothetical protein